MSDGSVTIDVSECESVRRRVDEGVWIDGMEHPSQLREREDGRRRVWSGVWL